MKCARWRGYCPSVPELDHIIFASPDLDEGVSHIKGLTGAEAAFGGPHIGLGSRNALLTFDDTTYFEVIASDPDQPEPKRPRPFGLDDTTTMHLAGWAIHPSPGEPVEDVVELMKTLGTDPGPISSMSRKKPDGDEISWRLTSGDVAFKAGGSLPFIIDWGSTPTPALSQPKMGELVSLTVTHPDAQIRSIVSGLDVGVEVAEGPQGLSAIIQTSQGQVELR